jgi:putative ABC transport system permease protein
LLGNYLAIAWRNLVRHKLHSAINIGGLALGLACAILLLLFIRDELSYDTWVPESGNLYRLEQTFHLPGRPVIGLARADFPLPALVKDNLPEVTGMTRYWPRAKTVTVDGNAFPQQIVEVDPDFFQVIKLPLVEGDPASVLARPDSIVLSHATARKYFGDADPVGRLLSVNTGSCAADTISCVNEAVPLRVTGVMGDLPDNTHMRGEAVIPHNSPATSITEENKRSFFQLNGYGYIRLAPGSDPTAVAAKIPALLDRNVDVMHDLGMPLQASKAIEVHLVPFTGVHLAEGERFGDMVPAGSRVMLYGLGVIGLLILLVACFNFTNLATARAMLRAREIALRKTAGAHRGQLIVQFLGEAVVTALLALALALSLVEIVLPAYGAFLERPLTFRYLADWPVLALSVTIAILAGLISGAYPALVLSRFQAAAILRASGPGHTGSSRLRAALVVLQFAVAIGLGIVTLAVFAQIDFARRLELGFRHDNIVQIDTNRRMGASERETFIAELRRHPHIQDVAQSADIPFSRSSMVAQMRLPGGSEYLTMDRQQITPEFFRLYGMQLAAGRFLSDDRGDDRMANSLPVPENEGKNIMINQTAALRFGFTPAEAVGKTVLFGPARVRIVGVLRDTRIDGAREPARSLVFLNYKGYANYVSVRIDGAYVPEVVDFIDRSWRRFAPHVAIRHQFSDELFAELYSADEKQGMLFGAFVAIAIAIACLGLFGLAAFTAARRTREIGIRKTFGARSRHVVRLLLWQFSIPVLLANLIAWPIAWLGLREWLQSFADRIALHPGYFIAVGLAALLIAWATVFVHAWRVAQASPVRALRYE